MASRKERERRLRNALRNLGTVRGRRQLGAAQQYASGKTGGVRGRLRRTFGAVGDFVATLADIFAGGRRVTDADVNDALRTLADHGYHVTPVPPGHRPEDARPGAPPIAIRTGRPSEPPDTATPGATPPPEPPDPRPTRPLPSLRQILPRADRDEDYPAEHSIDTRKLSAVIEPGEGIWGTEVETPQSSNVFSFAYDNVEGILYVTYKAAGKVDQSGRRPHVRGPMYSYGGRGNSIPVSLFDAMVRASSRGKFVWDHLRVRGTNYGHQYPYTLVSGDMSRGEVYVPRKATRRGFRTRSIVAAAPTAGTPRSAVARQARMATRVQSQLPERLRR